MLGASLDERNKPWTRLRQRLGGGLIRLGCEGLANVGKYHPAARRYARGLEVTRDIRYGPDDAPHHRLDVWRRRDLASDAPAVLFIHGGGFRILSKDTHWLMALLFARAGYVVFSINYRLAPRHPFPAALVDTSLAYRWVQAHGASFGADLSRLAVAGESAGANLTLGVTLSACYPRPEPHAHAVFATGLVPAAILPLCGIFQVSDPARRWAQRPIRRLFADRIGLVCSEYLGPWGTNPRFETELADPVRVLERGERPARPLPPTYLAVGTRDPIEEDTPRLARALEALDVPVRLDVYPGEPHAFHALVWRAAARHCWKSQLAFLSAQLEAPHGAGLTPPKVSAS